MTHPILDFLERSCRWLFRRNSSSRRSPLEGILPTTEDIDSFKRQFTAVLLRHPEVQQFITLLSRAVLSGTNPFAQANGSPLQDDKALYWEWECRMRIPNDPDVLRIFRHAIDKGEIVGVCVRGNRAMYDNEWAFRSCNTFFVGSLEIPSPAVFVLAGLDPAAMEHIYFHWQEPDPSETDRAVIDAWLDRRRQAFTDLLPFAAIQWTYKHPLDDYEALGTYSRNSHSTRTVEHALDECTSPFLAQVA